MIVKRNKCFALICLIPVIVSCNLLLYVYFNLEKNSPYLLRVASRWKTSNGSYASRPYLGLAQNFTTFNLGNVQTDVDRKEKKSWKKKREKLKRELVERCSWKVEESCRELQELLGENDIKSQERSWSSYADKGYAIVGQPGPLMQRLPQVLIIGAKKAGTRALLEFLRIHPSISAAGPELHFFDRYFYRGPAWYRSKLPPSMEGQLTVEKTPAYFVDREVPPRVKKIIPTARLLLVVRDPVVRALSDYTQSLSKHDMKNFRELALKNTTTGVVNVGWGPIRGGLYARHLQRWREHFPPGNIHVVSGEGLISDPAKEMKDVQDFLDLERVINDRHFYFNTTKGFPCLVKRERSGRPHCLGFSKGRSHPQIDKDTREILTNFYRPFNHKFYKMVGTNFGWP